MAALPALLVSLSLNATAQQTAKPEFSVGTGVYSSAQNVTITDATPGATICYTTNGFYPWYAFDNNNNSYSCTDANLYSGPITISAPETLAATAVAPGFSVSEAAASEFLFSTDATRLVYTIAGSEIIGYSGDSGFATSAKLGSLSGLAFDSAGNLYLVDNGNNVIRKVTATTGIITTVAGNGTSGYSGDGGPATNAEFSDHAWGIAVDSVGNIYIADTDNYVIRKVTVTTGIITTIVGNGTSGYSGDGGPAISAELGGPSGLALDRADNLYICDNDVIRKVTAATGIITTVVGNGKSGYSGDGGPATSAELAGPMGLAFDSEGDLYIADYFNNVIRKVTFTTGIITTVAGNGSLGNNGDGGPATSAELWQPIDIAVDNAGNLYITSTIGTLRTVMAATGIITQVGRGYGFWNSGDGGSAIDADLYSPGGLAVDSSGNLYISVGGVKSFAYGQTSSSSAVRMITVAVLPPSTAAAAPQFNISDGNYETPQTVTISDGTPGAAIHYTMDGSTPDTASYVYTGPINVNGNVTINAIAIAPGYLPSSVTSANYKITASPVARIWTVAGKGTTGWDGGYSGDGGPASSAELSYPSGFAFDSSGNLYIGDSGNARVRKVTASTGIITTVVGKGTGGYSGDGGLATSAELAGPSGLVFDSAGNLYIADTGNNRIRKVTATTGIITTVAGNGTEGYSGDNGPAINAELIQPLGVAVDVAGNLYIADNGNNVIRKVTATTGIITTVAGMSFTTVGSGGAHYNHVGYSGDGGPATSAMLNITNGDIAVDGTGNFYIADTGNNVIRKVTASTGIITTVVGNGHPGYSGDSGPPSSAELAYPPSVAADSAGDLYIADPYSNVIRMVTANMKTITTVVGNGVAGYFGDGGSAALAEINAPQAVGVDAEGNLYIGDYYYNVVREVGRGTGVSQITPTVMVTPSSSSITTAQILTVAITVSGGTGAPTPTGSVILTGGGYTSAIITLATGSATISIPSGSLTTGSDTLIVTYTPDISSSSTYTSVSNSASINVTTFTVKGIAVIVASGATTGNTSTITLTPVSGFTGTVNLSCAITPTAASDPATCSLSPASVAISGTIAQSATLTVNSTAPTTCSSTLVHPKLPGEPWYAAGGATLAFLLLIGIPAWRRNWRTMLGILALFVILSGGVLACGGGGGGGGNNCTPNSGTTAGTYTITVTGTSGTLTVTNTITLTVQ